MARYSYDLANTVRDLSDAFITLISKQPKFISLFGRVADATNTKHEWLEDQITPRSITAGAVTSLVVTVSAADYAAVKVGTTLKVAGDTAVFQITAKTPATPSITVALIAAHGSSKTTPALNDVLEIISTPQAEGSGNGDGEGVLHSIGTAYNYTQIFRKEAVLTGTAMAVNTYGDVDGNINRQVEYKMREIAYDMNRMAINGVRTQRTSSVLGQAGGLYDFATALSVTATGTPKLSVDLVNDGAEDVLGQGAQPNFVLCSIKQARYLSAALQDQVQIMQDNQARGTYVARVINDVTGAPMTIFGDYDMVDGHAFVGDSSGFGISYLQNRGMSDMDTTTEGYDGIVRTVMGELTFVFNGANYRVSKITGLGDS